MLAQSAMIVVFVLIESIRSGRKLTAVRTPKALAMEQGFKSVTVTESFWKRKEWNAINPTSEKPKFGRGTLQSELK